MSFFDMCSKQINHGEAFGRSDSSGSVKCFDKTVLEWVVCCGLVGQKFILFHCFSFTEQLILTSKLFHV